MMLMPKTPRGLRIPVVLLDVVGIAWMGRGDRRSAAAVAARAREGIFIIKVLLVVCVRSLNFRRLK